MTKMGPALDEMEGKRSLFAALSRTEIPLVVYVVIFSTMALLWIFQAVHEDLTIGLFTELLGAAFTLFIIDTLLVRAKTHRWKVVRNHVEYLISRNVNRLRDGVATRAFAFSPGIDSELSELAMTAIMREQRAALLTDLEVLGAEELLRRADEGALFTEDLYAYFNEKAEDLWSIINMKYAEYMDPELVSVLIHLHTQLKDCCGHIRQYRKLERFPGSEHHYRQIGRVGMGVSLLEVVRLLNMLKRHGYSEAASLRAVVARQ